MRSPNTHTQTSPTATAEIGQIQPNAHERLGAVYEGMQTQAEYPGHRVRACQDGSVVLIGGYRARHPHQAYKMSFLTECVVAKPNGSETGFVVDDKGTLSNVWLPRKRIVIGTAAIMHVANNVGGGVVPSFKISDENGEAAGLMVDWAETFFQEGAEYTDPPLTLKDD